MEKIMKPAFSNQNQITINHLNGFYHRLLFMKQKETTHRRKNNKERILPFLEQRNWRLDKKNTTSTPDF